MQRGGPAHQCISDGRLWIEGLARTVNAGNWQGASIEQAGVELCDGSLVPVNVLVGQFAFS